MTAEINSLKKECWGTTVKNTKLKPTGKKEATKKALPKKTKNQKKKANDKWAWKSMPPKETDSKENNAFVKSFKTRNTTGAPTTTTGQACEHYTTQKTARLARHPQMQWPKPTLPRSTPWTVILTRNESCARVKFFLGSG